MKIIWSPLSIERMEEISDYIASDNPSAANKWIDNVFAKADLLKRNPEIGIIVPELQIIDIHEIIYGNYRIIYRYDNKQISILTVKHFKQILPIDEIE
jgi:plasmid stabilization system protein ParE